MSPQPSLHNPPWTRRRLLSRTLWWSAGVLALSSCSDGGASKRESATALVVATPYVIGSLDPLEQGLWASEWGYGELLMGATEDGKVEPWLLQSLERETDTRWRLILHERSHFQNGRQLNAEALAELIEAHLADNPRAAALLPNAQVVEHDGFALLLDTGDRRPNLPNLLADEGVFPVFDAKALAEAGDGKDSAALAAAGLYTGPFTVDSLTGESLLLSRNPHWADEIRLPDIEVRFVDDGQARVLAVRNDEVDLAFYPPTEALRSLTGATVREAAANPLPLRGFLNTRGVLADPAVRRAVSLAIDYDAIAGEVMDGHYSAPIGMFPKNVAYARQDLRSDKPGAMDLLEQNGYIDGGDGVRQRDGVPLALVILSYSPQPDTAVIATALQAQLAEVGVAVEVREVPSNYDAMAEPAGWDIGLSFDSALGTTYDPIGRLHDFLHTKGQYNFGLVGDDALDALLDDLADTFDEAEQAEILNEIQQRVVQDDTYALFISERPVRVVAGERFAQYRVSSVLRHVAASTEPVA